MAVVFRRHRRWGQPSRCRCYRSSAGPAVALSRFRRQQQRHCSRNKHAPSHGKRGFYSISMVLASRYLKGRRYMYEPRILLITTHRLCRAKSRVLMSNEPAGARKKMRVAPAPTELLHCTAWGEGRRPSTTRTRAGETSARALSLPESSIACSL